MMSAIIKDAGDIWSRLFDHRPFLSGEIQYFLKEFEEKRSDREVQHLFEILEQVSEIKESQIDKVFSSGKELDGLKAQLGIAINQCDSIIANENQYDSDKALEVKRELRKTEWEAFVVDMDSKYQRVDKTFEEKENELKEFYKDLEKKLHLTSD